MISRSVSDRRNPEKPVTIPQFITIAITPKDRAHLLTYDDDDRSSLVRQPVAPKPWLADFLREGVPSTTIAAEHFSWQELINDLWWDHRNMNDDNRWGYWIHAQSLKSVSPFGTDTSCFPELEHRSGDCTTRHEADLNDFQVARPEIHTVGCFAPGMTVTN